MAIAYFYMTAQGKKLVDQLSQVYPGEIFDKTNYKEGIKTFWQKDNVLIFIMATGIVVRHIAPYIQSKDQDPAVVVCDQNGSFAISLLSGHLGGANEFARKIAKLLHGQAVITTATDVANVPAMDEFAKKNHLKIENIHEMKYISGAMVEQKPLKILTQWQIKGLFPKNVQVFDLSKCDQDELKGICLSAINDIGSMVVIGSTSFCKWIKASGMIMDGTHIVYLTAPDLILGTGCKQNMDVNQYQSALYLFLNEQNTNKEDIKAIATIEIKKDEMCIKQAAKNLSVPMMIYSKEDLAAVDLENASGQKIEASTFVKKITGVGSVSEASAYLAAGKGKIVCPKTIYSGITFSLAKEQKVLYL